MKLDHFILIIALAFLTDEILLDFHSLTNYIMKIISQFFFIFQGLCYSISYLCIAYFVFELLLNYENESNVRKYRKRQSQLIQSIDYNTLKYFL